MNKEELTGEKFWARKVAIASIIAEMYGYTEYDEHFISNNLPAGFISLLLEVAGIGYDLRNIPGHIEIKLRIKEGN